MDMTEDEIKTEFFHHLHDTIILLGGSKKIASRLDDLGSINQEDVDKLRNYNCTLIEASKDRLTAIHSKKIFA